MPYNNIPYLYLSGMPDLYHVRVFSPTDPYDADILESPHNSLRLNIGVLTQIGSDIQEKYESLVKTYNTTKTDQATGASVSISKTLVPYVAYATNTKYLISGDQVFSTFSPVNHNHDNRYYKVGDVVTSTKLLQGCGADYFAVVNHNHDDYFLKRTDSASDASSIGGYSSTALAAVDHDHGHEYLKRGLSAKEWAFFHDNPNALSSYREDLEISKKFSFPKSPTVYPQIGWDEIAKDADALVDVPNAASEVPSAQHLAQNYIRVTSHDISPFDHNHDESFYRRGESVYRAWSVLGSLTATEGPSNSPTFYHAEDFALRYHTHPDYVQPMRLEAEFYRKDDQVYASESIQNMNVYIFIMDFDEASLSSFTMQKSSALNPFVDFLNWVKDTRDINSPFSTTIKQPLVNIEGMSWSYITSELTPLGGVTSSTNPGIGFSGALGSMRNLAAPSWFLQNSYTDGLMKSSFNFIQLNPVSYNTTDSIDPNSFWSNEDHLLMKPMLGIIWVPSDDMPKQVQLPPKPGAFKLISPTNKAVDLGTDVTLVWSASSNVKTYEVFVNGESQGTTVNTFMSISGLDKGVTYDWYVVASNVVGIARSVTWSFKTKEAAPGKFNLVLPSNGAVGVPLSPVLKWEPSLHATSYEVFVNGVSQGTTTDTTMTLSNLTRGDTYTWYVVASNDVGTVKSNVFTFVPNVAPSAFTLSSPTKDATDVPVKYFFDYEISTSHTLTEPSSGTGIKVALNVTESDLQAKGFSMSEIDKTHVAFLDNLGNTCEFKRESWNTQSGEALFIVKLQKNGSAISTLNTDDIVTLRMTTQSTTDLSSDIGDEGETVNATLTGLSYSIILAWNSAKYASSYEVFVNDTSYGKVTETSMMFFGVSPAAATYKWHVIASNDFGSTPSDTWSFTTKSLVPGKFALLSPKNGATGTGTDVTLEWESSPRVESYEVFMNGNVSGSVSFVSYGTTVGTSMDVSDLMLANTHQWYVVATNRFGSTTSEKFWFIPQPLPGEFNLIYPKNGAKGVGGPWNEFNFHWSPSANATRYAILINGNVFIDDMGPGSEYIYNPSWLVPGKVYTWSIVASNYAGSKQSETWTFTD